MGLLVVVASLAPRITDRLESDILHQFIPGLAEVGLALRLGRRDGSSNLSIRTNLLEYIMDQKEAQEIYNLSERAINRVRDCAYQEQFILKTKSIDVLYSQVLTILEKKRLRSEAFLNRSKE
jgi:hypothetical protein